jgi:SAM-dependent methyltransferase
MDARRELQALIADIEPGAIWRPIVDVDDRLLAAGHEDMRDGSPEVIQRVDFQDRTVLDMGCNFGYYSFLAARLGARRVVGVDLDERVIRGARLLAEIHRESRVDFRVDDFLRPDFSESFDLGLLVNFIGKQKAVKGIRPILDAVLRLCRQNVIITLRPSYKLKNHLNLAAQRAVDMYGAAFVRDGRLHLAEYVRNRVEPEWSMTLISPDHGDPTLKRTYLLEKKTRGS